MSVIRLLMICSLSLWVSATAQSPTTKIHLDPTMAAAGYVNLQLDRLISPTVSAGVMVWHLDDQSWGNRVSEESSVGIRIDWFEQGVFESGWHSNAMLKVDLDDGVYARTRLKLTQTYQLTRGSFYANVGIGAQFVMESEQQDAGLYQDYQSWLLPAWELSVGRAF